MAEPEMVSVRVPATIAGLVQLMTKHALAGTWGKFRFTLQGGAPVGPLETDTTEQIPGAATRR